MLTVKARTYGQLRELIKPRASKYKEMAMDELHHAATVHDFATADIDALKKIYPVPLETEDKIQHMHKHFAECTAMVKHMLS